MVISQEKNECWSCHVTFGLTTKAWRYVTLVEVEVREGERERKHPSLLLRRLSCEGAEQRELFYQRRRRRRGRRPRDQEDDCTLRLFLHPTSPQRRSFCLASKRRTRDWAKLTPRSQRKQSSSVVAGEPHFTLHKGFKRNPKFLYFDDTFNFCHFPNLV